MEVSVTHIFHNCFVLDDGQTCFVFDLPAKRFRSRKVDTALQKAICNRDVIAFFSHSHQDHFAPDYAQVCEGASSVFAIISDDIEEMYPHDDFGECLIVEPDENYVSAGLKIQTLMSNDLGVAYLFETEQGLRVYNGGDLANWDWDSASEAELRFTRNFFHEAVRLVASRKPHIAFSNVDKRLESLAGGSEFVQEVKPQLFIPTHSLGRTQWLAEIHEKLGIDAENCFIYRKAGEFILFDVHI